MHITYQNNIFARILECLHCISMLNCHQSYPIDRNYLVTKPEYNISKRNPQVSTTKEVYGWTTSVKGLQHTT